MDESLLKKIAVVCILLGFIILTASAFYIDLPSSHNSFSVLITGVFPAENGYVVTYSRDFTGFYEGNLTISEGVFAELEASESKNYNKITKITTKQ